MKADPILVVVTVIRKELEQRQNTDGSIDWYEIRRDVVDEREWFEDRKDLESRKKK